MRRFLYEVSWAMLVVVLATVLAPTFAWEAVAGESIHIDHSEPYGNASEAQDHHGTPRGDGPDSQHQHPCAGHALGHLAAVVETCGGPGSAVLADEVVCHDSLGNLTYVAHVPEHPPQTLHLA